MAPAVQQPRAVAAAAAAESAPRPTQPPASNPDILPLPDLDTPSQTLPLLPRQQSTSTQTSTQTATPVQTPTIPAFYGSLNSGPDPGAVAGIVLGSVAGFILLLWLLYICINGGVGGRGVSSTSDTATTFTEGTASVVTRKSRRHRHRERSRERRRQETVEIRRRHSSSRVRGSGGGGGGGGAVIVEEVRGVSPPPGARVERVVSTEERRRSVSRVRRMPSSERGTEDEVVVIEERSPSRSRYRSRERRSSGFREVDPDRFAGGDATFVEVRRSGSHRR
ncbi:hypothetical protein C8A03DRAFT_43451 [Achaetomium macrosporum]|uniref:Uncharacterized protein n=1 Tax=Achaetomium macrosporum TaxID=79813 RepID=A0AAN7HFX6_9PEZI|nr:hypothetical protein C8A03DRAFT_43451 [Achaetomium macrosporum]